MLTVTRHSRYYYTLHISHEATETQRSQVIFPGSHSRFIVKWEIFPYSFEKVSESSVSPQTAASWVKGAEQQFLGEWEDLSGYFRDQNINFDSLGLENIWTVLSKPTIYSDSMVMFFLNVS